jgi:hypothetical protein
MWALLGVIGVILLVEGDITAQVIGSVLVAFVLGWIVLRTRHRFANHSH